MTRGATLSEGSDRILYRTAIWVIAGALLSGPIGSSVALFGTQPPWRDAATYMANFRAIEQAPFWLGFLFIGAWVTLFARIAALAPAERRTRVQAMLVAAAVFGAIISINYTLQVGYVPALVAAGDSAVGYVTMSNPGSLGWIFEMFGYGALGVACGLAAPLFAGGRRRRRSIVWLFLANGVVSVGGAVATAIDVRWVMTPAGLWLYILWNVLVVAMMAAVAAEFRPADDKPSG
jgi:hypothetical protein